MWRLNASDQVNMHIRMIDSEAIVKAYRGEVPRLDSESLTSSQAKLLEMRVNRDNVLTEFVRQKIRDWCEVQKREQKELAKIAGLKSPSVVSMVKDGRQGVGAKTAPGFARAFGYASVDAMSDAAWTARQGTGAGLERRLAEPAFASGVALVANFQVPPTDAELRTIANAYADPYFDGRDAEWWLDTVGDELKRTRARDKAAAVEIKADAATRKSSVRANEDAWREGASRKRQVSGAAPSKHARRSRRTA